MSNFEDWARDFSTFLEGTVQITGQWAESTLQQTVDTADAIAETIEKQVAPTLEQLSADLQQVMTPIETLLDEEVERFSEELTEFITPLATPLADALETWLSTVATPLNNTIDPLVNDHGACVGCRHYYGQAHGGNMLVCAMYPYGPDLEKCPDWQSVWDQPSNNG